MQLANYAACQSAAGSLFVNLMIVSHAMTSIYTLDQDVCWEQNKERGQDMSRGGGFFFIHGQASRATFK